MPSKDGISIYQHYTASLLGSFLRIGLKWADIRHKTLFLACQVSWKPVKCEETHLNLSAETGHPCSKLLHEIHPKCVCYLNRVLFSVLFLTLVAWWISTHTCAAENDCDVCVRGWRALITRRNITALLGDSRWWWLHKKSISAAIGCFLCLKSKLCTKRDVIEFGQRLVLQLCERRRLQLTQTHYQAH